MSKGKINEQILKLVKEISKDDKEIADFLTDLLFEEIKHSGQWWWKDIYSKKIKECAERWSNTNEN